MINVCLLKAELFLLWVSDLGEKGQHDGGLKKVNFLKATYLAGLVAFAIALTLLLLVPAIYYFISNSPASFRQLIFSIMPVGMIIASATLTWIILGNVALRKR
jgi:hypothetical protein